MHFFFIKIFRNCTEVLFFFPNKCYRWWMEEILLYPFVKQIWNTRYNAYYCIYVWVFSHVCMPHRNDTNPSFVSCDIVISRALVHDCAYSDDNNTDNNGIPCYPRRPILSYQTGQRLGQALETVQSRRRNRLHDALAAKQTGKQL